jgi:hypothetical protein
MTNVIHAEHLFGCLKVRGNLFRALEAVKHSNDSPVFEDIDGECLKATVKEMRALQREFARTRSMQVGMMLDNLESAVDDMVGIR